MSQGNFSADGVDAFLGRVRQAASTGILRVGEALASQMQTTLSGPSVSPPGSPPGVSDGVLRRSIASIPTGPLSVRVGSSVFYGLVQETGNWGRPIVPVRKRALVVPLSREAARLYRKQAGAGEFRSARNIPGLKLIPRRGKPALLVKEEGMTGGRGWRTKPLFILKKSVRLPKRPWAGPSLRLVRPRLPGVFASAVRSHLQGGAA